MKTNNVTTKKKCEESKMELFPKYDQCLERKNSQKSSSDGRDTVVTTDWSLDKGEALRHRRWSDRHGQKHSTVHDVI